MGNAQFEGCPENLNCLFIVRKNEIPKAKDALLTKLLSTAQNTNLSKGSTSRRRINIFGMGTKQNQILSGKSQINTQFNNIQDSQLCSDRGSLDNRNSSVIIQRPKQSEDKKLKIQNQPVDLYQLVQPSFRSNEEHDSEIQNLWKAATKTQNLDNPINFLQKRIVCFRQPDGMTYSGEYFKNQKHGIGNIVNEQGRMIYDGEWTLGKYQGVGTLYSLKTNLSKKISRNNFVNCCLDFTFIKQFQGNFENNLFHGSGIIEYADGSNFYGKFLKGKPHGKCTFESATDNLIFHSFWNQGIFLKYVDAQ